MAITDMAKQSNTNINQPYLVRALITGLLILSLWFGSIFSQRVSIIQIFQIYASGAYSQFFSSGSESAINTVYMMFMSSVFITFMLLFAVRMIFNLSKRFFRSYTFAMSLRSNNENYMNLEYPLEYNQFLAIIKWYVIGINIVLGLVRLIYFSLPYTYYIIESSITTIVITVGMLLFYRYINNKFLDDNTSGFIFKSLALPYGFLVIFML